MSADPRAAYVRFYLSVVSQLEEVSAALGGSSQDVLSVVQRFPDVVGMLDEAQEKVVRAQKVATDTRGLWRPSDPAGLTGLLDVYEVVGRFSFQGDENQNIEMVSKLVKNGHDEIDRQRKCLALLTALPQRASQHAEGLSQQELAAEQTAREERLKPFEPHADKLREQCQKSLDVIKAVTRPDLSTLEQADTLYQEYVRRLQLLYSKALPFLRRSLQELCAVAAVETPPSWPEVLPFAPNLPAELITPPSSETPATSTLKQHLTQLVAQDTALSKALDELAVNKKRLEGERAAFQEKDTEILKDVEAGKNIVRWATKLDEMDAARRAIETHLQALKARTASLTQLAEQKEQFESSLNEGIDGATELKKENDALAETLAKKKASPPSFFGKDDWRKEVEALEEQVKQGKAQLDQVMAGLNRQEQDFNALLTRVKHDEAQKVEIEKAAADSVAKENALKAEISEVEKVLGAHKPPRRLAVAQADEYLASVWAVRNETKSRLDSLANQLRRNAEETERATAARKQIAAEKQKLDGMLERAAKEAQASYADALKQLSFRRQTGFGQYVDQVLAPLEESLSQVDRIFIEPARQVLIQRSMGGAHKAGSLRALAEEMAQELARLTPKIEPVLTAQSELLKRIQQDFCEKVLDAVRSAWAA